MPASITGFHTAEGKQTRFISENKTIPAYFYFKFPIHNDT